MIRATTERVHETTLAQRAFAFAVLSAAVAAVLSQPIARLAQLAWTNDAYSHVLLIVPLSCALLLIRRKEVFARAGFALAPALGVAVCGLLLAIAAQPAQSLSLSIATLVVFWLACFVLCFGLDVVRQALFPLLMLAFLIPLPFSATADIGAFLQRGSAEVAYRLLQIATVPVSREGLILALPGLNLEIATECSGLRSSMLLLITSLVIGNVHLRGGSRQVAMALLVVPISILKNGVRVFTLAIASVYLDQAILSSWFHHNGGFLFFLLGLGLVICTVKLLQRTQGRTRGKLEAVTGQRD